MRTPAHQYVICFKALCHVGCPALHGRHRVAARPAACRLPLLCQGLTRQGGVVAEPRTQEPLDPPAERCREGII